MTMNRKVATFVPIEWHEVRVVRYDTHGKMRTWCKENCGVYKADWDVLYGPGGYRWRFRTEEHQFMFILTWVGSNGNTY